MSESTPTLIVPERELRRGRCSNLSKFICKLVAGSGIRRYVG